MYRIVNILVSGVYQKVVVDSSNGEFIYEFEGAGI